MTKQSSKYKSAPTARLYRLDCHATLAMNPSEAQDAARTQSAGDTRAGTIYYLCSNKKRGVPRFLSVCQL